MKESGERALIKCRDSSTWRLPSDSTRENNLDIDSDIFIYVDILATVETILVTIVLKLPSDFDGSTQKHLNTCDDFEATEENEMPKNISTFSLLVIQENIYTVTKLPLCRDVEMGKNSWEVRSTDSGGQGLFASELPHSFEELFPKTTIPLK